MEGLPCRTLLTREETCPVFVGAAGNFRRSEDEFVNLLY
jgi:hypothetical protein